MSIQFTQSNRRIYTRIAEPTIKLEPQQQIVWNIVTEFEPINRFELLHILITKIESKRNCSEILSCIQRYLVRLGCLRIEEPSTYYERIEKEKDRKMSAMIVPNGGGFSIQVDGEKRMRGWYVTVAQARNVVRTEILNEQPPDDKFRHKTCKAA